MIKFYKKSYDGYLNVTIIKDLKDIIKDDDFVVKHKSATPVSYATINVITTEDRHVFIRFPNTDLRDKVYNEIITSTKEEYIIQFEDMYPSKLPNEEAFDIVKAKKYSPAILTHFIRRLKASDATKTDALIIFPNNERRLIYKGQAEGYRNLPLTHRFTDVKDKAHFLSTIWALTLDMPITLKNVGVNYNQFYRYVALHL